MNTLPDNIKNYLFISKVQDYSKNLYKLCLEKLKQGHLVLLITSKEYDFYMLHKELQVTPAQLKRLIIMQLSSLESVTQKLLSLHNWPLMPTLVILDLCDYLQNMDANIIMEQLSYCLASLFNYMQSIHLRQQCDQQQQKYTQNIYSLVLINKMENEKCLTQNQINVLKNLYYYEMDLYDNLNDVSFKIKGICK